MRDNAWRDDGGKRKRVSRGRRSRRRVREERRGRDLVCEWFL